MRWYLHLHALVFALAITGMCTCVHSDTGASPRVCADAQPERAPLVGIFACHRCYIHQGAYAPPWAQEGKGAIRPPLPSSPPGRPLMSPTIVLQILYFRLGRAKVFESFQCDAEVISGSCITYMEVAGVVSLLQAAFGKALCG